MKILFDDDPLNSNPTINSKNNILFINIEGNKGMNTQKIKKYIEYIKILKNINEVYFDWDLTLSKRESIDIIEYFNNRTKEKYKKNMVNYFGTDLRRSVLRKLFKTIRKKKAEIFILTRNPTALYKKERIFFSEMINSLEGNRLFKLTHLYYCPANISKSAFIKKISMKR